MEKEPVPQQPEDLDKEAAKLFKEEDEKTVEDLQEALHIRVDKGRVGWLCWSSDRAVQGRPPL